jgi:membrane-associated protein
VVPDLVQQLNGYFQHYGYWTLALALLLENAGVPVPGETILIVASVLANTRHTLSLPMIVLVGTVSATLGDNIGYVAGHWGGRPLLDRYSRFFRMHPDVVRRGEKVFERYGAVTVFFARFIFGLRIIAGPLAGVLKMDWWRFALFNVLGAVTWVSVIATIGYEFGHHLPALLSSMRTVNIVLTACAVALVALFWRRIVARLGDTLPGPPPGRSKDHTDDDARRNEPRE